MLSTGDEIQIIYHLRRLQDEIGAWGDETFGAGDSTDNRCHAVLTHFREEGDELLASQDPEEAADCALLLLQFAHRRGFLLADAILRKHAINVGREWGPPDADGVCRHVKAQP